MSAMKKLLLALLEKTGITWFFTGVSVEFPACFVPNFRVVEIQSMKNATQSDFAKAGN
jgi:hypothetical protein